MRVDEWWFFRQVWRVIDRDPSRTDLRLEWVILVLGEVVRVLAWTWLRVQAYYEQQQREDGDE